MSAVIARNLESSELPCDSTPLKSLGSDDVLSALSTSTDVPPSGLSNTDDGLRQSAYDAGMRRALAGYINTPLMEQISLELTVTRVALQAVSAAAEQREILLSHWKGEARWWKEEHDRVHGEYCATIAELGRKYAR